MIYKINFTEQEQNIINLLKIVAEKNSFNVRICGGFVRDKLLGLESNDIDIAVDNMSGQEFAKLVVEYMNENNLNTKGVTVVKANPDQSKHLETAMVSIFGMSIDFANLRKETYTTESRIPIIEFGTPFEDASRRDLTINSLFYNINTCEIEDYIGGINDLQNKIARTPIDPIQTFMDDPLRILRIIRFASRFDLKVSDDIIDAANVDDVKLALSSKISKERIWKEYAGQRNADGSWKPGFICGNDPAKALSLVIKMHLHHILNINIKDAFIIFGMDHSLDDKEKLLVRNLYSISKNFDSIPDSKILKRINTLRVNQTFVLGINNNIAIIRRGLTRVKTDWDILVDINAVLIPIIKSTTKSQFIKIINEMGGYDVQLPVSGDDLINAGLTGKDIGTVLKRIEEQWFINPKLTKKDAMQIVDKSIREFNINAVKDIIT